MNVAEQRRTVATAVVTLFVATNRLLLTGVCAHGDVHHEDPPPLLVISFDGFRYDYVDRITELLPGGTANNFLRVKEVGSYAVNGIENVYATKTAPNHYSLVTGLYEESHGITGNVIFDEEHNSTLHVFNRTTFPRLNQLLRGEPIWDTYAKQQKSADRIGCYMWFLCDSGDNATVQRAVPYTSDGKCLDVVNTAVQWVQGGVQLSLLYHNEPDHVAHRHGVGSKQLNDTLLQLNHCLGSLLDRLSQLGYFPNAMNLLLVSDHGMVDFKPQPVIIPERPDLYRILVFDYQEVFIRPHSGKLKEAKQFLNGISFEIRVFEKTELPKRWHYGRRFGNDDLLVVANLSSKLGHRLDEKKWDLIAGHGYDNQYSQMHPMFLAAGRSLQPNHLIESAQSFRLVDVYTLMCLLLNIAPSPNNGSLENAQVLLRIPTETGTHWHGVLAASVATGAVLFGVCLFVLHCIRHSKAVAETQSQNKNGVHRRVDDIATNGYRFTARDQTMRPLMDASSASEEEDIDVLSEEVLRVVLQQ